VSEWVRGRCDTSACIEIQALGEIPFIVFRSQQGSVLVSRDEWDAFVTAVKAGDFDTV